MDEDNFLPFALPAVCRKKVSVAFDGGRLSSDGGVVLLRDVERRLELAARLAGCVVDRRDPARIEHEMVEMLRLRMFLIAAGHEDADDCDALRTDPIFKLAVGRLPETAPDLCSQPTMTRLENAPSKIALARMMVAMVDLFCASWARPPTAITLDIDDTRASTTVAVQRPLRRALLLADPYLRGGERQTRGRHPAAGKDAGRMRQSPLRPPPDA
jgi:Transposase DDE domain group 1